LSSLTHELSRNIRVRPFTITADSFRLAVIWLLFASSFIVIIEPAPVDLVFILAVPLFLLSGLSISVAFVPLILWLLLYNIGAFLSYMQVVNDSFARMFVITSVYMACSAIFFAFFVAQDPMRRMPIIKSGLTLAATLAAILGVMGAMNIAGLGPALSLYGRATGAFKDPNVFSTYLLLPAVMLVQGLMLGEQRHKFLSLAALLVMVAGLFLSFSRGAWISFLMSTSLMVVMTYVLTPSKQLRGRIVSFGLIGLVCFVILMSILLSFDHFRQIFLDRLTLVKDYDAGETGRFGNQLNSIPLLLERPLGFGPLQFHKIFRADPHNTFINGFASYGWLGGISYILLLVNTIIVGVRSIMVRSPWQKWAIVVFCPLLTTMFQGVQIDTDHWRHFYWMLGMTWGLFAASMAYEARNTLRE
jgi:hypothetical protein